MVTLVIYLGYLIFEGLGGLIIGAFGLIISSVGLVMCIKRKLNVLQSYQFLIIVNNYKSILSCPML
jgi:hypothetical protein